MLGRLRLKDDRHFNLNNIKKGAEKRAADDFADSLKKMTGITISHGTSSDITAVAKSTSNVSRKFVDGQVREINNAVMRSSANGDQSNSLTNFIGVSKIGYTLLINSGQKIQNTKNFEVELNKLEKVTGLLEHIDKKPGGESVFSNKNITELNESLIKNKVITSDNKLAINKNDIYGSFKKFNQKLDIYSRQTLKTEITNVSQRTAINMLNDARKKGNADLANVLEMHIAIKEMTTVNNVVKKPVKIKGSVRRLVNMNFNDESLQGMNQMLHYKSVTQMLVKTTQVYYKGIAKSIIKTGDFGLKGTSHVLNKVGFQKASASVMNTRNTLANVGNGTYYKNVVEGIVKAGDKRLTGASNALYKSGFERSSKVVSGTRNLIAKRGKFAKDFVLNPIKETKSIEYGIKNTIEKLPGNAVHGVRVAGRTAGRGVSAAGKIIGNTRMYASVSNSVAGRATGKLAKTGARSLKNTYHVTKKVGNVIFKPITIIEKGILRGLNAFNLLIKKLLVGVAAVCGGIALFSAVVVLIIAAMSAVGDAVSKTLDDFMSNTTMGATYEKLLQKEQEFNNAVTTLATTLTIPEGYAQYGIKKYSNVNIHYLGADGKEISWSGAIGDVEVAQSEVTNQVWSYLKKKGWSDIAIAGLLGNMQRESNFRVTAMEHGSDDGTATMLNSGFGLCQWTNTQGNTHGRRYGLFQYAAAHGGLPSDVDMQLGYLLYGEGSDSVTARNYGKKDFSSVAAATEYFCREWERPNDATSGLASVRIPAAQKFYELYTNDPDFANIIADGSNDEDTSGDAEIIASAYSTSNTTTIKGILAMAAVYIEQDFKKYGAFADGVFADSLYKDYAAKLYDSSHIIGIDETPPVVYYCPALSAMEPEPEYHVASSACDNKIPGGNSEDDWLNSGTGINRKFSLSLTKTRDSYEHESTDDNGDSDTETVYYDRYEILETGPHGKVEFDYDSDNRNADKEAKAELLARGCKNYTKVCLDRWDGGGRYAYVCHDDECRGHIDADAYVFVANIYDPTSEVVSENTEDKEEGEETETENNSSKKTSSNGNGKSFNYVDKTDKEYKYSMYALDKYATAFDSPDNISGRAGDQESVNSANGKGNKAAEQFIMEDITGLPMKVVDWWKNDNWFTNLSTTKTYFRLPDFEDSIDTLPTPEPDENGDYNVVNKGNSTPYWFNAFTSESGRNTDFEKHGWDNDSIILVRLLMANDWTELYGIKDFGYIQGAPMTEAQIAQLISNNTSWEELCDDRKNIMAQAILFQQKAQAYDLRYVLGGSHSARISDIKRGDTFDCSGYISSIMYNAGLFSQAQTSTVGLYNSPYFRKLKPGEVLTAGDILIKYNGSSGANGNGNHVVLYMGGNNVSEARGKKYPLSTTFNYSRKNELVASGQYEALRLTTIDETKHTIDMSDLTGSN